MRLTFYLSIRALAANSRSAVIIGLSVMITVTVFIVMSSILFGFRTEFIQKTVNASPHVRITTDYYEQRQQPAWLQQDDIISKQIIHIKPIQTQDKIRGAKAIIEMLATEKDVLAVSPVLSANVLIKYGSTNYPAVLYGVIPEQENKITDLFSKATVGRAQDLAYYDKGVMMGRIIADKLGVQVGDTVKVTASNKTTYVFRLIAIINSGVTAQDNSRLWVRLKDAQAVANRHNEVTSIGVKIRDYNQAEKVAEKYGALFGYRAESWQQASSNILSLLQIIFANVYFVLGGVLIAAGFGIYNVSGMAVNERRRDLAIMRAMGISRRTIIISYLLQGVIIGLLGCIVGILAGSVLIDCLANVQFGNESNNMRLTDAKGFAMLRESWLYVLGLVIGMLLAVFSSIIPSWQAGRLNPVDIIREG